MVEVDDRPEDLSDAATVRWRLRHLERMIDEICHQGTPVSQQLRDRLHQLESDHRELRTQLYRVLALLLGNLVGIIVLLVNKLTHALAGNGGG